jgi:prefoldin subunit 5
MAPINYVPGMLISSRVFPCPRKSYYGISPGQEALNDARVLHTMLIYGHTPTPPAPATLTQEQLARDAGQLVQAHAVLDKLVDDTDRSQHSLLSRIQQIADESEKLNKILESAALNPRAGLVSCVEALKKRCEHHAKAYAERGEGLEKLYSQIRDLKERNKRLHEAQGSGSELAQVRDVLSTITSKDAQTALGMAKTVVTMNLNQRTVIQQLREEAAADPIRAALRKVAPCNLTTLGMAESAAEEIVRLRADDLSEMVQACHNAISGAGHSPEGRTLLERVCALLDRESCHRETLREVGIILDRAGIPNGSLFERVRVAIERGQQPKPKPDYEVRADEVNNVWQVVNPQGRVVSTCVALADAQRICNSLRVN